LPFLTGTRGNSFKLYQEKFMLNMWKNFFSGRVVRHWNRLSRGVVELLSLKAFKKHVDVALKDVV